MLINERNKRSIEEKIQTLRAEESSNQQFRDGAELLHQSIEALKQVFAKLKAEGIIHYRVYAEIRRKKEGKEGKEEVLGKVGLIETKGFSPDK